MYTFLPLLGLCVARLPDLHHLLPAGSAAYCLEVSFCLCKLSLQLSKAWQGAVASMGSRTSRAYSALASAWQWIWLILDACAGDESRSQHQAASLSHVAMAAGILVNSVLKACYAELAPSINAR